jgi:hypothetical protein
MKKFAGIALAGLILIMFVTHLVDSKKQGSNKTYSSNYYQKSNDDIIEKSSKESRNQIDGLNGTSVSKDSTDIQKEFRDGRTISDAIGVQLQEPDEIKSGMKARKQENTGAIGIKY